ncbi:MAG: hypothetical protein MUF54_11220 [Polyangiaceae bacterium]|nr:hypothetical protein [Polyangiaceae bacterium]
MPAILALVASLLGLVFAGLSTYDYVLHLDRQLHDVHCSFVPGLAAATEAENSCRTAMYSAYSAVFRGNWWGGIPVSLAALGVYAFFAGFAISLLVGGSRASRRAYQFFGVAGLAPLLVSVVMAFISAVKLGVFCKTCVGLYFASALLAAAAIWGLVAIRRVSFPFSPGPQPASPYAAGAAFQGPSGAAPQPASPNAAGATLQGLAGAAPQPASPYAAGAAPQPASPYAAGAALQDPAGAAPQPASPYAAGAALQDPAGAVPQPASPYAAGAAFQDPAGAAPQPALPYPSGTAVQAPAYTVPQGMPLGHPALIVGWIALLGACVVLPALVYVANLPDYRPHLASCGTLPKTDSRDLIKLAALHPKRDVILFADPLCPTCKALHDRLTAENVIENLNISLALMPLDNDCNWMLDRPMHPGSCLLSKAVICADQRGREALEWMYGHQEELAGLAKAGEPALRARIKTQFGGAIDQCIDAKKTTVRLNNLLQYAVVNQVPVSTPQMYLGEMRICDEDTDLGLRYTLAQLAPEVLQ